MPWGHPIVFSPSSFCQVLDHLCKQKMQLLKCYTNRKMDEVSNKLTYLYQYLREESCGLQLKLDIHNPQNQEGTIRTFKNKRWKLWPVLRLNNKKSEKGGGGIRRRWGIPKIKLLTLRLILAIPCISTFQKLIRFRGHVTSTIWWEWY